MNAADQEREYARYVERWDRMCIQIWRDRLRRLRAVDTGRLLASVSASPPSVAGFSCTAEFRFLEYGIYVDRGTGRGYTRGNGGDLSFLSKAYRRRRGLGEPRTARPWFSVPWYRSFQVLKERTAEYVGTAFLGALEEFSKA